MSGIHRLDEVFARFDAAMAALEWLEARLVPWQARAEAQTR